MLKVKRLDTRAVIPTRSHLTDAGLDLYALENAELPRCSFTSWRGYLWDALNYLFRLVTKTQAENQVVAIRSGISIELPPNTMGFIHNRSSMGKRGIMVFGGIVDEGYTGEIMLTLANVAGQSTEYIKAGDRVAQLIIVPILTLDVIEVIDLGERPRGNKGFGSSGK